MNTLYQNNKVLTNEEAQIIEYIKELKEYKKVGIDNYRNNFDFETLIKTDINNFINNNPLLKQEFNKRVNYFEDLVNNDDFKKLLVKTISVKNSLLQLINIKSVNAWQAYWVEEEFLTLEKALSAVLINNNSSVSATSLINNFKNSLSYEEIELYKKELLNNDAIIPYSEFLSLKADKRFAINRGESTKEIDYKIEELNFTAEMEKNYKLFQNQVNVCSERFFFWNQYLVSQKSWHYKDNPLNFNNVMNFYSDKNYTIYEADKNKKGYLNTINREKCNFVEDIKGRIILFQIFIKHNVKKNFLEKSPEAENLLKVLNDIIEEFKYFLIQKPNDFYFKYFYDVNYAFNGCIPDDFSIKGLIKVLEELKAYLQNNNSSESTDNKKLAKNPVPEQFQDTMPESTENIKQEEAKKDKYNLNNNQIKVFDEIAKGTAYKAIASKMNLSVSRIKGIATEIRQKLNVRTNAEAINILRNNFD